MIGTMGRETKQQMAISVSMGWEYLVKNYIVSCSRCVQFSMIGNMGRETKQQMAISVSMGKLTWVTTLVNM